VSEEPEVPEKVCIFCAGTGKIRDIPANPTPFGGSTYFTVNPEDLPDFKFYPICGT
jgi:hypothetical protein